MMNLIKIWQRIWPKNLLANRNDKATHQSWNDETRSDLRAILHEHILGHVRLAKFDRDVIFEICQDIIEDECPEEEVNAFYEYATHEYEQAVIAHKAEQRTWPMETDSDRLDQVEQVLQQRGILLWQASTCCNTCSEGELPDRIDEVEQRHAGFIDLVRGYAFFIDQNMPEMLAEDTHLTVYLAYGWFPPDDSRVASDVYRNNALGIAKEICDCLEEHGFELYWDGDFSKKIGISLNWQRRTMLQ